ncbi:MAG: ester cyclase [Rhodobacteraceae bacterium]|nr:ester cyclase [Paracoccaceae bacterium]
MAEARAEIQAFLTELWRCNAADPEGVAATHLAKDAVFDISAPVGTLRGRQAILSGLIWPMRAALGHLNRRDEIFIGGRNTRAEGGTWMASLTHYAGRFTAPLFGVLPSDRLVFLRTGEFYRIENGQITQGRIIIDLLDLMHQTGCFPLARYDGAALTFPGPMTHDGVCPPDRGNGARSLGIVEAMLDALHDYNPATFGSPAQTGTGGFWCKDMMWYGPGGIGATIGWDGFVDHHRAGFLRAFPDRKGGNHYCRIGDGHYAAVSGWPSMTMTHLGPYLGVPATGASLTLRVMDFYRCTDRQIAENWVLLDYIDLLGQMGRDPIADSHTHPGLANA